MSNRPAFILAYAADGQGCGLHRVSVPLASLMESGVADGRIDMQMWPVEAVAAAKPDVIIFQRQVEDSQIELMQKYREALPGALFIYELDDYLGEVPAASFHAGFMPPNLAGQVSRAMAICDRATTTTEPLAQWLRELGAKDVVVVPNALPQARIKEREPRPAGQKLRIGFAGGISHAGDLELLRQAMTEISSDEVTWVFMGMKPKNPPVEVEFHEGVAPLQYMDALAALDLDLVLAPLEDNRFNFCKSNLRILEAGAVGACVIAQYYEPYLDGAPPVFDYATDPTVWTKAIRLFVDATPAERGKSAKALQHWVGRKHTLEKRLHERAGAWLPDGVSWRPTPPRDMIDETVAAAAVLPPYLHRAHRSDSLVEACQRALATGSNVLWMRPGTTLDEGSWHALRLTLAQDTSIASASPIAPDGANSFPRKEAWSPVYEASGNAIAAAARKVLRDRRLLIPAPTGPCILLSRAALAMGGVPDVDGNSGNEEVAILEWGLRLNMRGWRHMQAGDAYAATTTQPQPPTPDVGLRFQARAYMAHNRTPIEELSTRDRADLELELLRTQWAGLHPGVGGFDAGYQSWATLKEATAPAERGFCPPLSATASYGADEALRLTEKWVIFVDEDVTLKPGAWAAIDRAIEAAGPDVIAIYGDHENKVNGQVFPDFKPGFDWTLFLGRDYVTPICAVRSSILSGRPPADSVALYTAIFDAYRWNMETVKVVHIPEVLATVELDISPEAVALKTVGRQAAIQRAFGDHLTVTPSRQVMGALNVRWHWEKYVERAPKATVIIPTLGNGRLIQPCVNTLLQHTAYPNFDVLVVQNGAWDVPDLGAAREDPRVRVVRWEGNFNWSAINNWAVREHAKDAEYLLFMNDDVATSSLEGDWMDAMLGQAVQPDIGAVGARLIHPAGVIQHVGVVVHNGIAGHMHKGLPNGHPGYGGLAALNHEASAVTGACMMVSSILFDAVGGFDEGLQVNYNDTDFCMKLRKLGLRNVVEMSAELLHAEGTTRESPSTPTGAAQLISDGVVFSRRWPEPDPYWNQNLALLSVQNGLGVQGLNCDTLFWNDRLPGEDAPRMLVINDLPGADGQAIRCMRDGFVPYLADLSGFTLRLIAPMAVNAPGWDIRRPREMERDLKRLGIDRIVLCSLIGSQGAAPPVEALRFLAALGVNVEMREVGVVFPNDPAAVGEVFGAVDVEAWKDAYDNLTGVGRAEVAAE